MRVEPENFTILANPAKKEITLLIAGARVTFDVDEARNLTVQLVSGIQSIHNQRTIDSLFGRADQPSPPAARPADDGFAPSSTAGDEVPQAASSLLKQPAQVTVAKADAKAVAKAGAKTDAKPDSKSDAKAAGDDKTSVNKLRSLLKGLAKDGRNDVDDGALELR